MASNDLQQQWAAALKKSQQKSRIPLESQIANIKEKINFLKSDIFITFQNKNKEKLIELYNEMVSLRAELITLQIRKKMADEEIVTEEIIVKHFLTFVNEAKKLGLVLFKEN